MNDRTRIAAMILAGPWAPLDKEACRIAYAIAQADALMAALAKTEPPPTIEEVTEGRTVTVYPCPKCGETDPSSLDWWRGVAKEADQQASELRNKLTAAVAQLETVEAERNHAETTANLLGAQLEDAEARVKELEADVERWQRNYNSKLLEWDKSLMKWRGIIGCGLSTNQPELLIVIDAALEQGVKDAARVKELEAGLEACAESLELSLSRLGCGTRGNDGGGDGKHDADSMGGIAVLEDARDLLRRKAPGPEPVRPTMPKGCHRAHPHPDDPDCPGNLAFYHGKREGLAASEARIKELETSNAHLLAQIAALLAAQMAQQQQHKRPMPIPFEWTCSTGPTPMLQEDQT